MAFSHNMGMFPMVYRRKTLFSHSMGMVPKVFIHELQGNVSYSLCALKFVMSYCSAARSAVTMMVD